MRVSPGIPIVTGFQMAAVDRAMVEVCGLELMQVMEVAGRAAAIAARRLRPQGSIAILCGSGGNGGDAFVCARYLAGWGYEVQCWLMEPASELRSLAGHQMQICRKLAIPIVGPEVDIAFPDSALIVDGIFGFGLKAAPDGRAAGLIEAANDADAPILAIDIPSGVDATSGSAFNPAILADHTLTLGLPKQGLLVGDGPAHAGTVIVADIGIPAAAYAAAGIPLTSIFDSAELVTLDGRPWPV
jgi:NAD(P)H-hydrate epimerase